MESSMEVEEVAVVGPSEVFPDSEAIKYIENFIKENVPEIMDEETAEELKDEKEWKGKHEEIFREQQALLSNIKKLRLEALDLLERSGGGEKKARALKTTPRPEETAFARFARRFFTKEIIPLMTDMPFTHRNATLWCYAAFDTLHSWNRWNDVCLQDSDDWSTLAAGSYRHFRFDRKRRGDRDLELGQFYLMMQGYFPNFSLTKAEKEAALKWSPPEDEIPSAPRFDGEFKEMNPNWYLFNDKGERDWFQSILFCPHPDPDEVANCRYPYKPFRLAENVVSPDQSIRWAKAHPDDLKLPEAVKVPEFPEMMELPPIVPKATIEPHVPSPPLTPPPAPAPAAEAPLEMNPLPPQKKKKAKKDQPEEKDKEKQKENKEEKKKVSMDEVIAHSAGLSDADVYVCFYRERNEGRNSCPVKVRWCPSKEALTEDDEELIVEFSITLKDLKQRLAVVKEEAHYREPGPGEEDDLQANRHLWEGRHESYEEAYAVLRKNQANRFPPVDLGDKYLLLSELVSRTLPNARMVIDLLKGTAEYTDVACLDAGDSEYLWCGCTSWGRSEHCRGQTYSELCRKPSESSMYSILYDDDELMHYFVRRSSDGMMCEIPRIRADFQRGMMDKGHFPWNPFFLDRQWLSTRMSVVDAHEIEISEEDRHDYGMMPFEWTRTLLDGCRSGRFSLEHNSQIMCPVYCYKCGSHAEHEREVQVSVRTEDGPLSSGMSSKKRILCPAHGEIVASPNEYLYTVKANNFDLKTAPLYRMVDLDPFSWSRKRARQEFDLMFVSYDAPLHELCSFSWSILSQMRCHVRRVPPGYGVENRDFKSHVIFLERVSEVFTEGMVRVQFKNRDYGVTVCLYPEVESSRRSVSRGLLYFLATDVKSSLHWDIRGLLGELCLFNDRTPTSDSRKSFCEELLRKFNSDLNKVMVKYRPVTREVLIARAPKKLVEGLPKPFEGADGVARQIDELFD